MSRGLDVYAHLDVLLKHMQDIYFDVQGHSHVKPEEEVVTRRVSGYPIILHQDRLLMVKPTNNDQWELPGGGIELNEYIREGIVRECYEESGYRIQVEEQPVYVGERNFYLASKQKYFKSLLLMYRGTLLSEVQDREVINTVEKNEIEDVQWLDPALLGEEAVHPMVWPVIKMLFVKK